MSTHDTTPVKGAAVAAAASSGAPRDDASVRVAVRVRPSMPGEDSRVCLFKTKGQPQLVLGKDRSFTFDHVFDQKSQQSQVQGSCVTPLIESLFQGFNATVFAYGQTGSGKTYTMGSAAPGAAESRGVIPRAIDEIFARVEKLRATHRISLRVSFLEIYNEEIRDLLDPAAAGKKQLRIREDADGSAAVQGAEEERVVSAEQTLSALHKGSMLRVTHATNMNEVSSRSHAIFTVYVDMCRLATAGAASSPGPRTPSEAGGEQIADEQIAAKFHFVALAGSERAKRTQAEGQRMKEGIAINLSLLVLGNVISALGDERRKGLHVPYRDSVLTRLLQNSLGGNSRTLMIACVAPTEVNLDETLNTLRYANRAKNIKNKPVVNRDPHMALIAQLRQHLRACQTELLRLRSGASAAKLGLEELLDLGDNRRFLGGIATAVGGAVGASPPPSPVEQTRPRRARERPSSPRSSRRRAGRRRDVRTR